MSHSIFGKAVAVACLFAGVQIHAATFTVTSMADSGPGTLRDAINRANATSTSDHRIEFALSGTVVLASELPTITTIFLEIDGGGRNITISGNSLVPIFVHRTPRGGGQLTLRRLHLSKAVRYAVRGDTFVTLEDSSIQAVDGTGLSNSSGSTVVNRSSFHNINGTALSGGRVQVLNSTFTRNTVAPTDSLNGKLGTLFYFGTTSSMDDRSTQIRNVTISDTSLSPGTVVIWAGADVSASFAGMRGLLTNTIITNTVGGSNCRLLALPPSWSPNWYDGGGNLVSDDTCGLGLPTSTVSASALLGPLQDNGGPTLTMQPLTGSPAINGGVASTLTTDQRGYARLSGAAVDKGAVEVAGSLGLRGLFFPIRNWPIFNDVLSGGLVPVRFGFNGYQGMAVLAKGYPQSAPVSCTSGPFSTVAEYAQSGGGGLTYDTKTLSYQYVLATQASWKGTCRRLMFRYIDGSSIDAYFRFN